MAVTAIWKITSRFDRVIDYAENPEKTVAESAGGMARLHAIDEVIDYAADETKTEECRFVTGVNCDPDNAKEQFKLTKLHWNKTGGILAFHGYQSFAPGEVDADTAHRIGVQLAEELWGKRFEVVVCTHCNSGVMHNHFVLNSVSLTDGGKYNDCKAKYQLMRDASDRLCREYGLSVIEQTDDRTKSFAEWQAERSGSPTLRSVIREAIDTAIKGSVTKKQFLDAMNEMGFVIDQKGKYPKIKQIGNERFVRFKSLGQGYSVDEILTRIYRNNSLVYPDIPDQESPKRVFDDEPDKPADMDIIAVNRCYFKVLTVTKESPRTNRRMYFLVRQDHSAMRVYQDQLNLVTEHRLKTEADVRAYQQKAMGDIDSLTDTRRKLRNDLKRAERLGEPDRTRLTGKIRFNIGECTKQLAKLRREVTSCEEVLEHLAHMRENLTRIDLGRFKGKDSVTHEPPAITERKSRIRDL